MTFDEWFFTQPFIGIYSESKEAWDAATIIEREACAMECNPGKYPNECDREIAYQCAERIRRRSIGETK